MSEHEAEEPDHLGPFAKEQLFLRDLSEVYLLLDFISGRADKSLSGLRELNRVDPDTGKAAPCESPQQVIQDISEITYPPGDDKKINARRAALITSVKDKLNYLASPARGFTISFTAMFSGVATAEADGKEEGESKPSEPHFSTALAAYPNLRSQAMKFRRFYKRLPYVMFTLIGLIVVLNIVVIFLDPWAKDKARYGLDYANIFQALTAVVVPAAYGGLGTLAGVMRALNNKIRESTLAPRDFLAAQVGIGLGVAAGLIVGLLISGSDVGDKAEKTLPLAALSFLAGFGSEGFFRYIEGLLPRIFPATHERTD